jgi:RimJ/RimL family protein N-acetyltransferase
MLQGKLISLKPYTLERCHEFWREYVSDPDMWEKEYIYDKERADHYYQQKVMDKSRCFFAICYGEQTVGEIQLKYIDVEQGCGTMSIHFSNDQYKNHGWGTEAERLIVDFAFHELKLHTVYADCVLRNRRSQHVLEKVGFVYTHEDDVLRYYKLER